MTRRAVLGGQCSRQGRFSCLVPGPHPAPSRDGRLGYACKAYRRLHVVEAVNVPVQQRPGEVLPEALDPIRSLITVVYAYAEAIELGTDPWPRRALEEVREHPEHRVQPCEGGVAGGGLVEEFVGGEDEPARVSRGRSAEADGYAGCGECVGVLLVVERTAVADVV